MPAQAGIRPSKHSIFNPGRIRAFAGMTLRMEEPVYTVARREERLVTPRLLAAGGTIASAPASP